MTAPGAGPRISVFIPTHEHASTLPYAVRSVRAQGVQDMEILICGDGATEAVRAAALALQRDDPRIRFFDLPKAPARGELNRDRVLREARGEFVFHQNDDDLWLPGHVEMLGRALTDADFVGAMQVNVTADDGVRSWFFDLERPEFVEPWLAWQPNDFGPWSNNGFGPIFAAHRRDAYLRLPEGWTTTPDGLPADQFMWHKFVRQPWCRVRFLRWPVALHFHSPDRRGWSPAQRAEEIERWTAIIERPDYAVRVWQKLLPDLGDRLLDQALAERDIRREARAARAAKAAQDATIARLEAELAVMRTERDAARAERLDEYGKRLAREKDLNDLLSSTSWRLTGPLRAFVGRLLRRSR